MARVESVSLQTAGVYFRLLRSKALGVVTVLARMLSRVLARKRRVGGVQVGKLQVFITGRVAVRAYCRFKPFEREKTA